MRNGVVHLIAKRGRHRDCDYWGNVDGSDEEEDESECEEEEEEENICEEEQFCEDSFADCTSAGCPKALKTQAGSLSTQLGLEANKAVLPDEAQNWRPTSQGVEACLSAGCVGRGFA